MAFAILLPRVAPSLQPQDAAEFLAATRWLGVTHAPGYPLYVLLGRVCEELLPGGRAYALNVFSAMAVGGSAAMLWSLTRMVTGNVLASVIAVGFLLASPPVIRFGLSAEVYAVNLFFVLLLVRFLLSERLSQRGALGFGLLVGLAVGHHQTAAFVLPGAAPVMWKWWLNESFSSRLRLTRLALIGLSLGGMVFLVSAIRALADPPLAYGDPNTPHRLVRLILRSDYGTVRAAAPSAMDSLHGVEAPGPARQVYRSLVIIGRSLQVPGVVLALVGFAHLRHHRLAGISAVLVMLCGPVLAVLAGFPAGEEYDDTLAQFHLPACAMVATWAGSGGAYLYGLAVTRRRMAGLAISIVLAGALLFPLVRNWETRRYDFTAVDLGHNILVSLPLRTTVFLDGDTSLFVFWAMQSLGKRPDIRAFGLPVPRWYARQVGRRFPDLSSGFEAAPDASEIVERLSRYDGTEPAPHPLYTNTVRGLDRLRNRLRCEGLVYRLIPSNEGDRSLVGGRGDLAGPNNLLWRSVERGLFAYRNPGRDPFIHEIAGGHGEAFMHSGYALLTSNKMPEAIFMFERAKRWQPRSSGVWKGLGVAYYNLRRHEDAVAATLCAEVLNPNDPEIPNNLGIFLFALGRRPEAAAAFRRALGRNPGFQAARQNLRLVPGL